MHWGYEVKPKVKRKQKMQQRECRLAQRCFEAEVERLRAANAKLTELLHDREKMDAIVEMAKKLAIKVFGDEANVDLQRRMEKLARDLMKRR